MPTRYAFIFHSPHADHEWDGREIFTGGTLSYMLPVGDAKHAAEAARQAVANGVRLIELSGVFDDETVAEVQDAVGPAIPVGVVRYPANAIFALACATSGRMAEAA